MLKFAVLGCGPAGLMAAHGIISACAEFGVEHKVQIWSRKRKSQLFGAQYLHYPIPDVTDEADVVRVDYLLQGSVDGYRRKVYGPMWDGKVSPEDFTQPHQGWNIRSTYDNLWTLFQPMIVDQHVDPAFLHGVLGGDIRSRSTRPRTLAPCAGPSCDGECMTDDERDDPFGTRDDQLLGRDDGSTPFIVNSIPKPALCMREHRFGSTDIIAAGDAPALGIDINKMFPTPDNTVICNGDENPSWYRKSRVFGHTTVEWPSGVRPPVSSAATVQKPTYTDCDCWPNILHVGRYGTWRKGVLSHTAWSDAYAYAKKAAQRVAS